MKTPTVGELIDEYEAGAKLRGISPTQMNALKVVRRALGHYLPGGVGPTTIHLYVEARRAGKHTLAHAKVAAADGTIRRELGALSAVLNWAADKRLIKRDEVPTIDLPPPSPLREVFLVEKEADAHWLSAEALLLMEGEHQTAALFYCLSLDTWARANAIETLTWDRVLGRQIDYREPGRTETSKRRVPVPISPRLAEVLNVVPRFPARDALVVGPVTQYAWQKFKAAIGMRAEVTRHDMRRTGISLAMARGVDPMKVAQMAGDDLETILKHYARFAPDYLKDVFAPVQKYWWQEVYAPQS